MAATYKLTPHETATVVRSEPEVLAGELTARVDGGEEQKLHAGETLDIPAGTKHQMWNAAAAEARVRWETRPAGRTEEWFRAIDAEVRKAGGKQPGPLAL